MTVRMIAQELYQRIREVEELEKLLQETRLEKRPGVEERLRKAKAERNRLRAILESKKE